MLIYFILLMSHVWIGTTFDIRRPTRDRMSARNVVISIFGSNANKPDSPTANLKEKMLRIPSNNNFNEIVLAELNYNDKLSTKSLVQIYPLTRKFITRPYYPILFNIPLTDFCCVEHGRNVLNNNNRLVKHSVPYKDALVTTNKLVPLITKNKGIFNHKDNSTIDGIETKKDITETDLYNQSRIHAINQEQSKIVSNVSVETEKITPAYNEENSKRKQVEHSSQLKDVGKKDLKDIKMHENETTTIPETAYNEEVISTTEVFVDIEENYKNNVQFLNYTLKSPEPAHSNYNIITYPTTEQVKIQKDFIPYVLKKYISWSKLFSPIAKINTSIPLKGFQNVTNNYFTVSDFKSKIQSSQKQNDGKENVVQQRIIINSDNISNDSVAYIKSKLSLSNLSTLDKPILFPSEKPELYKNTDDSETLVRKFPKLSLKEGNRGDIPDLF
ncbi:uncharacterized protein LOC126776180 [Nymphalis io]|uniref:uncharacterized protein LOC126776180 n=1 Tax=Inachis io TaxID=171585 RepID=UPI002169320A|nr:uncharacterized protein LOC126776180 [Nymphalis io]